MKLNDYLNYEPDDFWEYYECPKCSELAGTISSIYEDSLHCDNCNYEGYFGIDRFLYSKTFLEAINYEGNPVYQGTIALNNSHNIKKRKDLITENLRKLYEAIDQAKIEFEAFFKDDETIENPSRNFGYIFGLGNILVPICIWRDNNHNDLLKETFEETMVNIDEITNQAFKYSRFRINELLSESREKELFDKYNDGNVIRELSWIIKIDFENDKIYHYKNNKCNIVDCKVRP